MRGFIMGLMKNLAISGARSARSTRSTGTSSTGGSGYVEVIGFNETDKMLGELMTTDPYMARKVKTFIRKALKQARKELSDDAKKYLKSDPRRAARAVKFSVYKAMFGGNLSILQKGRGTAGARYKLIRKKKLQPGQRGGNRITRVDDSRNRLATDWRHTLVPIVVSFSDSLPRAPSSDVHAMATVAAYVRPIGSATRLPGTFRMPPLQSQQK